MCRRAPYKHARPLAVRSNVNGSGVDDGDGGCSAVETPCVTGAPPEVTDVVSWTALPVAAAAAGPLATCATMESASGCSVLAMAFCPAAATAGVAARAAGVALPPFDVWCVAVCTVEVATEVELTLVASAVLVVVTGAAAVVVVVCVAPVPLVTAGFAFPDTPAAAPSIPLASINGYAVEPPPACRERADPRVGVSPTSLDDDAFGAYCVGCWAVGL